MSGNCCIFAADSKMIQAWTRTFQKHPSYEETETEVNSETSKPRKGHKLKMIQAGRGIESKKDQAWLRVLLQIQFEKLGEGWHGCHSLDGRYLRGHGGCRCG